MAELMDPRKKYQNPPIQEAVCEVHFILPEPLHERKIREFGSVWKTKYPNQQTVEEKAFRMEIGLGKSQVKEDVIGHKLLAKSNDGKDIAQLASRFLAVNRIPPYAGWEESFRSSILERFYEAHESFNFSGISRINLRYINKIEIQESPLIWKKWFTITPPIPASLSIEPQFTQSQTQLVLGGGLIATIQLVTLPEVTKPTIMLDIDVALQTPVSIGELPTMLDKVHTPHNVLFESYLTQELRAAFIPI